MTSLEDYRVSNSNGSKVQLSAVRVYFKDEKIAEVFPPKRNPLDYVRTYTGSKYRKDLIFQLQEHGLSMEHIQQLLKL